MMTPASKVVIRLTDEQRQLLQGLVRTGTHKAHARTRAQILLRADAGGPDAGADERIAEALGVCRMTVARARRQFAAEGLDATLHKKRAAGRQYRKLDGAQEAQLIALTCSPPPAWQARWAMKLLADKLVELEVVEAIDPAAVWRALKKTTSSRGSSSSGSSRPGRMRRS
jgi:transposase